MRILAVSGSLRYRSTNTVLLRALALLATPEVQIVLYDELEQIPPFNPDLDAATHLGSVDRFRSARDSDIVVFSTSEYAHGVPGAHSSVQVFGLACKSICARYLLK